MLVCDQAFEDFTYENEMITPAALPGMFERTVTVFSFSKGMGFSGLRVGYIVCCDSIIDPVRHRCRRGGSDLHCCPAGSDGRRFKTPAS